MNNVHPLIQNILTANGFGISQVDHNISRNRALSRQDLHELRYDVLPANNRVLADGDLPALFPVQDRPFLTLSDNQLQFEIKCDLWNLSTRLGMLREANARVRQVRRDGGRAEMARNNAESVAHACLQFRTRVAQLREEVALRSVPVMAAAE